MDVLEIDKANLIGNSFGGALAIALTIAHPERVNKLLLMGSVGVHFEITSGLDAVWGYEPSSLKLFDLIENSQLNLFAKCGHWTQIEHTERFNRLAKYFFSAE